MPVSQGVTHWAQSKLVDNLCILFLSLLCFNVGRLNPADHQASVERCSYCDIGRHQYKTRKREQFDTFSGFMEK